MAILTESKIKKLLRTTNLKETKSLVLEPGTVITPSAKEYLKDINIDFKATFPITQVKENEPKDSKSIKEVLVSDLTYHYKVKVDITISHILILQKKSHHEGNMKLVNALNIILMVANTLLMETLTSDKAGMVHEIEKLLDQNKLLVASLYPEGSFIPTYKDEEAVIALFELHAYLQELEHLIAKEMKDILTFEDYMNSISIANILKEYCWILMVQSKEKSLEVGAKI